MSTLSELIEGLPLAALVALLALVLVQVALQVYALIDLSRRPTVAGGRKWVWVVVIVAGNLVGAIVYLAVGRPATALDTPGRESESGAARERALDRLYGMKDRE